MTEQELKEKITELESENKKMKTLYDRASRVGRMGFLISKVFQESDATLEEVYLTFGYVLGHVHGNKDLLISPPGKV